MECQQKGSRKRLAADMSFVVARGKGGKGVTLGFRVPTTSVGERGEGVSWSEGSKGE